VIPIEQPKSPGIFGMDARPRPVVERRVEDQRMTAKEFRKLALALPEAVEAEHMGHPDFRVRNKIFATLGPDEDWGMVKLTPDQQAIVMQKQPKSFEPGPGAWGRRGATLVRLRGSDRDLVRQAMIAAWRNTAPKKLSAQFEED
jgi:hypothetical protein